MTAATKKMLPQNAVLRTTDGVTTLTVSPLVLTTTESDTTAIEFFHTQSTQLKIVLLPNANATVTEFHEATPDTTHTKTEITLANAARLQHTRVELGAQNSNSTTQTDVVQEADSHLNATHFSFGGKTLAHTCSVTLAGAHAHAELNGLYAVKTDRHINHTLVVNHLAPETTSRQLYKGLVEDHSKAVFNGKIIVARAAQKTSAVQLNKNLLLGEKAEAKTNPQLEINADDVKCNHGATVGQLNAEEVFYLESRGIPHDTATRILIRGFAKDVLDRITDTHLRLNLNDLLTKEFFSDPSPALRAPSPLAGEGRERGRKC